MQQLSQQRGNDGKRVFTIPASLSSQDPAWNQLDTLNFAQWLQQHGYDAPHLMAYINYATRDDYGARKAQISAWAGLHYFCSRNGKVANGHDQAWLTWPGGLNFLAQGLAAYSQQQQMNGSMLHLEERQDGIHALCFELQNGIPRWFTIRAQKAICALPLHVAIHTVPALSQQGFNASQLPDYAPWLVGNFMLHDFPPEKAGYQLCWDNVLHGSDGLGYIVASHQQIRRARPPATVFTSYRDLSSMTPQQARHWLANSSPQQLLQAAMIDLEQVYDWRLRKALKK